MNKTRTDGINGVQVHIERPHRHIERDTHRHIERDTHRHIDIERKERETHTLTGSKVSRCTLSAHRLSQSL